jgi:sulfopyruvate decarboxylase alpha subunit
MGSTPRGKECRKSQSDMRFCALMKSAAASIVPPLSRSPESKMHARSEAPTDQAENQAASWPQDIFTVLERFDVRQVPYVPDAGHSQLIQRVLASKTMRGITLTTEEEGVALIAGAWAGGQRSVLLMQSSGVGNCINMLSLVPLFRLPFFTIVTMRGEWGEFNHWQVPMGSTTQAVFEISGIKVLRANTASEVREVVEAGAAQAYNALTPTAVLLSQRLIGAKVFVK